MRRGTRLAIRGRLLSASGRPLAGRRVRVALASEDRVRRPPAVRTNGDGRIALTLRARRSAAVTLTSPGAPDTLASSARLALAVPAPVTIAPPPGHVEGGAPVRFHGRVRGGPIPRRGKLVEVQAHFRGSWRTISAVRSRRDGRWRFPYAFRGGAGRATYRMRARAPVEAGYPFAAGASRPIRVTVGGRSG